MSKNTTAVATVAPQSLRSQIDALMIAAKSARSKTRFDAAVAAGLSPVECSWAASSTIRKTAKGEIAFYLISHGPGVYTCATLRKAIQKAFPATAAQVDVALAMLQKGFALRTLVGLSLDYDAAAETVSVVARKGASKVARKAPRKAQKALPAPVETQTDAA